MKTFAQQDLENNGDYLKLLGAVSKLSGLFSEGTIPYVNYRVAENIFCRSFGAENLSRSDTAFDAKIGTLGIGLKTFVCPKAHKVEKVAEFNSLSSHLSKFSGLSLAQELATRRNERIDLACNLYGIEKGIYHIVARSEKKLKFFETDYNPINIGDIRLLKSKDTTLSFSDGINEYSFNYSKSTLYRRFVLPSDAYSVDVDILDDPYLILKELCNWSATSKQATLRPGIDYVVLPLYSTQGKDREVPQKSGLNQWNALGRKRDAGEVYIPVPIAIHKLCPGFFPDKDVSFSLDTPKAEQLSAKLCQDNSKALMTNPNNALADWLLRGLFKLKERELLTKERMLLLGFDSVIIYKIQEGKYKIDIQPLGAYEEFIAHLSEND